MTTKFRAMGTEVTVVLPHATEVEEAAATVTTEAFFVVAERRFSRFRPDSELCSLNRSTGVFGASKVMFQTLLRAKSYFDRTNGLFDPAILGALVAAGYDLSFELGVSHAHCSGTAAQCGAPATGASPPHVGAAHREQRRPEPGCFRDVRLHPEGNGVVKPPHIQLDLGGMIKGHTVDLAGRQLPMDGAIDAGGDIVVRGSGPEGSGWLVEVENPVNPEETLLTLRVRDRAIATSASNRRKWKVGETWQHHLIDPRTSLPAESDLLQVTVLAEFAEFAEVLAKVTLLKGLTEGQRFLKEFRDVAGILVTKSGVIHRVGEVEVCDG